MATRARARGALLCTLTAVIAIATVYWLALRDRSWLDYNVEARPAVDALVAGHFARFLALAPSYGGSLLLRAPIVLLAHAAGGDDGWLYRASTMMCLLAAAGLGLWLARKLRARGQTPVTQALTVGLCAANPMVLEAIRWGHPEEILGGALCVFAVLAALDERPCLSGVLLGLAIANKNWALVAVGPVLVALPARRSRTLVSAAIVCAIMLAPFALAGGAAGHATAAATTGATFQRWQVWWFFGSTGSHLASHPLAIGYRSVPPWVSSIAHPLIVVIALGLSAVFGLARRRRPQSESRRQALPADALLLLALVMLLRCALDPWDISYYMLPFLLALTGWEAAAGRPPIGALGASVGSWFAFDEMTKPGLALSTDAQAAIFIGLVALAAGAICVRLSRPAKAKPCERADAKGGLSAAVA